MEHWQIVAAYLFVYDIAAVNFSYFFGLWLRFDFRFSDIPIKYFSSFLKFMPIYTVFAVFIFLILRLYQSIWRFASYTELNKVIQASAITAVFHSAGITLLFGRMPLSYYFVGAIVQFFLIVAVRFSYRFVLLERSARNKNDAKGSKTNVMIIGAGSAGQIILRELLHSREAKAVPRCIIDDNPNKWGRYIEGVPVAGGRDDILLNVKKYGIDEILFAIPTASPENKRDILNICKETGCHLKSLPGVYQLVNGDASLSKMQAVSVEDLLGRKPISVNMDEIFQSIKGKTILVTGGGGSIGSELCRQIAGHAPGLLIIFEIYENNAYDIEQELKRQYPDLNLRVLIGSVRDSRRVDQIFHDYHPDIVYHAAAHKHVPLMETSPCEAIKNNVIGTYKTAYAALRYGCRRFVLISTDKAVNPTNIMGASKRLCEMVIQSIDAVNKAGRADILPFLHAHAESSDDGGLHHAMCAQLVESSGITGKPGRTEFVAVRFGNVLGSNGSVIPLFQKQIECGGPVTVTHKDITRFFMTIPEAVSLVLQAGTYAKGGEIFVLDMGDPVKIDALARNLIKLSGFIPDQDIKIVYTGLRPGEKLYEEKLMAEEGLNTTPNKLIYIGRPLPIHAETFFRQLEKLAEASYSNSGDIVKIVREMVPTFRAADADLATRGTKACQAYAEAAAAAEQ